MLCMRPAPEGAGFLCLMGVVRGQGLTGGAHPFRSFFETDGVRELVGVV